MNQDSASIRKKKKKGGDTNSSAINVPSPDPEYMEGEPRYHHRFYLEGGDLLMRVSNPQSVPTIVSNGKLYVGKQRHISNSPSLPCRSLGCDSRYGDATFQPRRWQRNRSHNEWRQCGRLGMSLGNILPKVSNRSDDQIGIVTN
jgi:hypothetical protein